MLGKELPTGWDILALEFGPDFALGWTYAWTGTETKIRVKLDCHRARSITIC